VPGQEQPEGPSRNMGTAPEPVTTLMLRNLPRTLSQAELMAKLDLYGCAGWYDFCYMPRCFHSGENKGFAFVNFTPTATAERLVSAWHQQRLFGSEEALNISMAELQGFGANVAKWNTPRSQRIRNPDFVPFIVWDKSRLHGDSCVGGMKVRPSVARQIKALAQATTPKRHCGQRPQQSQQQQMPFRMTPAGERLPVPRSCKSKHGSRGHQAHRRRNSM